MNNLGQLPGTTWDIVLRLWPVLLIAAGLDGFWRGEGYAGATVVTGLGVIFLLGNLGYLTFTAWDLILRLWPILLVAVGLDIILGRRRPWSAVVGVLIGLVVTAGIFWVIVNAPVAVTRSEAVNLSLNQARSAQGTISLPVGRLNLNAGAEGNTLLEGNLQITNSESLVKNVSNSGDTATFNLESHGFSGFVPFTGTAGHEDWKVSLNPDPTYDLDLKLAVGEHLLDLTRLKLKDLTVQSAVGKTVIVLPASGTWSGRIQSAIGETIIQVPAGAAVRIRFERALTSTTQPSDFIVSGRTVSSPAYKGDGGIDLTISQAIGMIRVEYLQGN
jgi:hypothetical protein